MRKSLLFLFAAVAAFVSCGKELNEPEKSVDEVTPISFDLSANHPDMTKAVKGGWEAGDVIFVFFDTAVAPKFLKMSYDGSVWTSDEYDGATPTAGALGLKNGDTGMMRAVYLPFGNTATVSANGMNFVFSKTYYSYYLTARIAYNVEDNKVSGVFNMEIPYGYVQFFVEDAEAVDEAYMLGCDAVIPVGVRGVGSDISVLETDDKISADDMPGFKYRGGYLFSGKLTTWNYGSNYYFAKTKVADGTRHDYFVTGKTLASHDAVKLPAASNVYAVASGIPNSGKWVRVGSGITVELYASNPTTSIGTWYTCNYNCVRPEQVGTTYNFNDANNIDGVTLPTKEQFELIAYNSHCSWTWLEIHGQGGMVLQADSGLLFWPGAATVLCYWSSTENIGDRAYDFVIDINGRHEMSSDQRSNEYAVRAYPN